MGSFVDPRPHWEAELAAKHAELEAATDDAERTRLETEIRGLQQQLGRGGLLRFVWPWHRRSVPW